MSARTLTRIATTVGALALLAGALATSAVAGDGRATDTKGHAHIRALLDGRSPDTIDATRQTPVASVSDLRSPDTHDTALSAAHVHATPVTDLRSPDTRDANLIVPTNVATPVVLVGSSGFDWTDAGIGATSGFAVAILAAGALLLIRRTNGRRLVV